MIVPISEVALGDYKDQLPQCPESCCNRAGGCHVCQWEERVFRVMIDVRVLRGFFSYDIKPKKLRCKLKLIGFIWFFEEHIFHKTSHCLLTVDVSCFRPTQNDIFIVRVLIFHL